MTHLSDELLSAHIDGDDLWSPDAAHLDECDECRNRLEGLRRVVAAVATPVAVPAPHLREAAVAGAMVETTGVGPNIRRLSTRRARAVQSHVARRMSGASAAAALIVALGVGGWAISQVGNSGGGDSVATNAAGALQDEARTESATAADAAGGASDTDNATMAAPDGIGEFSDIAAVADRAKQDLAQSNTDRSAPPMAAEASGCAVDDVVAVKWHVALTYNGVEAWARVVDDGSATWLLQVLRRSNCEVVASQAIEPTTPR